MIAIAAQLQLRTVQDRTTAQIMPPPYHAPRATHARSIPEPVPDPACRDFDRSNAAIGAGMAANEDNVAVMIAAITSGNTETFAVFYQRWFDRGVDLVRVLTRRDESFCLDVVHDAMVRAIRSLRPRLGITTLAALDRWMSRVIHTTAIDHLRRESRQRVRERRRHAGKASMSPAVIDDGGGTDRGEHGATTSARVGFGEREGPARDAEIEERIAWIRQRLVEVHSIDRELIEAHYGRGQTVVSAAAASGVKPGAATGRLTRVIAGLRTKAKELFNDEA